MQASFQTSSMSPEFQCVLVMGISGTEVPIGVHETACAVRRGRSMFTEP